MLRVGHLLVMSGSSVCYGWVTKHGELPCTLWELPVSEHGWVGDSEAGEMGCVTLHETSGFYCDLNFWRVLYPKRHVTVRTEGVAISKQSTESSRHITK